MSIDTSDVRRLAVDLRRADGAVGAKASSAVRRTARLIEGDAQRHAPKDTGNLAASISTDITGDGRFGAMEAEIGPTADYGADVEYGTQPHIIRAKPGGVLAFPGGAGGTVFAREVHHPGTAPQPYMGPAFDRSAPGLEELLARIGEDIL